MRAHDGIRACIECARGFDVGVHRENRGACAQAQHCRSGRDDRARGNNECGRPQPATVRHEPCRGVHGEAQRGDEKDDRVRERGRNEREDEANDVPCPRAAHLETVDADAQRDRAEQNERGRLVLHDAREECVPLGREIGVRAREEHDDRTEREDRRSAAVGNERACERERARWQQQDQQGRRDALEQRDRTDVRDARPRGKRRDPSIVGKAPRDVSGREHRLAPVERAAGGQVRDVSAVPHAVAREIDVERRKRGSGDREPQQRGCGDVGLDCHRGGGGVRMRTGWSRVVVHEPAERGLARARLRRAATHAGTGQRQCEAHGRHRRVEHTDRKSEARARRGEDADQRDRERERTRGYLET
jgi:hypothetical protein